MTILELIEGTGYAIRHKAACHGGEYCGPCPFCQDGDDRFLVWPQRPNKNGEYQGGRFFCRICGKCGDAITFLRELHGLSYRDACKQLSIEPKTRDKQDLFKPTPQMPIAKDPSPLWQEKASAFAEWCHAELLKNKTALDAIVCRGLTSSSMELFRLGFCPQTFFRGYEEWGLEPETKGNNKSRRLWLPRGFTIPTFGSYGQLLKIKIRRSEWDPQDRFPKYVEVSGSKQCPSIYGDSSKSVVVVLEAELDAILTIQECGDMCCCLSLGGAQKRPDIATSKWLKERKTIIYSLDFDDAGKKEYFYWRSNYSNLRPWPVPEGKSPEEAFVKYHVNLRDWLAEGLRQFGE